MILTGRVFLLFLSPQKSNHSPNYYIELHLQHYVVGLLASVSISKLYDFSPHVNHIFL